MEWPQEWLGPHAPAAGGRPIVAGLALLDPWRRSSVDLSLGDGSRQAWDESTGRGEPGWNRLVGLLDEGWYVARRSVHGALRALSAVLREAASQLACSFSRPTQNLPLPPSHRFGPSEVSCWSAWLSHSAWTGLWPLRQPQVQQPHMAGPTQSAASFRGFLTGSMSESDLQRPQSGTRPRAKRRSSDSQVNLSSEEQLAVCMRRVSALDAAVSKQAASPSDASPLPVPRRHAEAAEAGDAPLPMPRPDEMVAPAQLAAPSAAAPGHQPSSSAATQPRELGPQLGTWANRQFRLLEAVPERSGEGPASNRSTPITSCAATPTGTGHGGYESRSPAIGTPTRQRAGSGSGLGTSAGRPLASPGGVKTGSGSGRGGGRADGSAGDSGSAHCSGQGSTHGSDSSVTAAAMAAAGQGASGPTLLEYLASLHPQQLPLDRGSDPAALGPSAAAALAAAAGRPGEVGERCHGGTAGPLLLQSAFLDCSDQRAAAAADAEQEAAAARARRVVTEEAMQDAAWRWRFTRRWQVPCVAAASRGRQPSPLLPWP
jgi:hypothetical protein